MLWFLKTIDLKTDNHNGGRYGMDGMQHIREVYKT